MNEKADLKNVLSLLNAILDELAEMKEDLRERRQGKDEQRKIN